MQGSCNDKLPSGRVNRRDPPKSSKKLQALYYFIGQQARVSSLPMLPACQPASSLMLGGEFGSAVCMGSKQGINQQGRRVTGVTVGSLGKLGDIEGRGSRFNGRLHVVVVIVGQMNGIFLSPVASTITQSISYSPFHRFSTFKFPLKPNILGPLFPSRREYSWCRC